MKAHTWLKALKVKGPDIRFKHFIGGEASGPSTRTRTQLAGGGGTFVNWSLRER
jgi:hypothetical protein